MTLTLPPEYADLLVKAGGRWPEIDEDRVREYADTWERIALRLSDLQADSTQVANSVTAINSGAGIEQFGVYWEANADVVLPDATDVASEIAKLLGHLASGTVQAKQAILTALKTVLDMGAIGNADPRIIAVLAVILAAIIAAFLAYVVYKVATSLGGRLRKFWEDLKSWFKKLKPSDKDKRDPKPTDDTTKPSHDPDPDRRARGEPEKPTGTKVQKEAIRLQNDAADLLAQQGYDVERIPKDPNRPTPDYRIEGRPFEHTAPISANLNTIWVRVETKVKNQADRVVLDLRRSDVDVDALRDYFQHKPVPGLKELIVILPDGSITRF